MPFPKILNTSVKGLFILWMLTMLKPTQVQGQTYFTEKENAVFKNIYSYRMLTADSLVKAEKNLNDAVWPLLSANVAWSEILAGNLENDQWNEQFRTGLKESKKLLDKKEDLSDEELFYFIIIHAFKTRHELLNNNYLNAASDLNTCIGQISDSFGKEEEYEPLYLTSGLYYYFIAKAYDDYKWLRPYLLLYPKGDSKKGLSYLYKLTTSSDVFLKNESNYFLMRIYYDLEKDYKRAEMHARYLLKYSPDNLIYRIYYLKIIEELGQSELYAAERLKYIQMTHGSPQLSTEQKQHFISLLDEE